MTCWHRRDPFGALCAGQVTRPHSFLAGNCLCVRPKGSYQLGPDVHPISTQRLGPSRSFTAAAQGPHNTAQHNRLLLLLCCSPTPTSPGAAHSSCSGSWTSHLQILTFPGASQGCSRIAAASIQMAAPPPHGAQHVQFSLPPITPEQQYVQKRQGEEVQRDVRTLNTLDANEPFANLQDAVLRLLPFHVSARAHVCLHMFAAPAHAPHAAAAAAAPPFFESRSNCCGLCLAAQLQGQHTSDGQPSRGVGRLRHQHACVPVLCHCVPVGGGATPTPSPHIYACAPPTDNTCCVLHPQLFNSVDPALADLDDTPDHMGADLMASRHDAWEQLVIDKVGLDSLSGVLMCMRVSASIHASRTADRPTRRH